MKTTTAILSALVIAGTAGILTAEARPGKDEGRHGPKAIDTNDDGEVTIEEFTAAHKSRVEHWFDRLDKDTDGVLTAEEFEAAADHRRAKRARKGAEKRGKNRPTFDELDADGDQAVSLDEFTSIHADRVAERFDHMDEDGDGVLTDDELPRRGHRGHGRRGPDGHRGRPERGGGDEST
jgi:hypothetical protein